MSSRRTFLRQLGATGAVAAGSIRDSRGTPAQLEANPPHARADWLKHLQRVAGPVIENLSANRLQERMPVEAADGQMDNRRRVTHLEAVGRTLAGIAPWLELADKTGAEADLARQWTSQVRQGLANATDPTSPDYLDFAAGGQCLVDSAFLAHAFLRAPRELWAKLDSSVQGRLVEALKSTRLIKPGNNNWLLFSAMVETFLAVARADWQPEPIEKALQAHEQWYKGDGVYGDGPDFHWDYYNSFVIQPFLIDVLEQIGHVSTRWAGRIDPVLRRARRYAAVQERLIAPDGSFPVLGRSIAYRCGAFQLLAQMALRHQLPAPLSPGQVRCALSAVIDRTLGAPGTFDPHGWLTIGLAGHQPGVGESYISTGSLYLCTVAFLPLGLPAQDPFWAEPFTDWTARRAWSGKSLAADHAL